jgi:hypothetical protein
MGHKSVPKTYPVEPYDFIAFTACRVKATYKAGVYKFSKTPNCSSQNGDMNEVPYSGPKNIRHRHARFSRQGDLVTRICTILVYGLLGCDAVFQQMGNVVCRSRSAQIRPKWFLELQNRRDEYSGSNPGPIIDYKTGTDRTKKLQPLLYCARKNSTNRHLTTECENR